MRYRWLVMGAGALFLVALGGGAVPDRHDLTDDIKETLKALPHLHGARVTDATFERKVVIVTFFASWCPPCREEFGHLQELHARYHQAGVEVIAINLFEDFDNFSDDQRLATFLTLTRPPFTVVKGNAIVSQQFGGITRIPTLFVFDREGWQVLRFVNEPDRRQPTLDPATLHQVVSERL
ncbi:Thiol-disulfide oxidoreductase ResA [Candidatus Entotheonellaceae bacterium PAL068K]